MDTAISKTDPCSCDVNHIKKKLVGFVFGLVLDVTGTDTVWVQTDDSAGESVCLPWLVI